MSLQDFVSKNITGRIALVSRLEAEVLERYAALQGDHVEIGCLWGATAILAALAKRDAKVEGHVYTIDKMSGGFWQTGDKGYYNRVPTRKIVIQNFERTQTQHDITLVEALSDPWPLAESIKPTTVLIDGSHTYEGCKADWLNVKRLEPEFVLFHDYASGRHPGVQKAVDEILKNDPEWKTVEKADTLLILGKARK